MIDPAITVCVVTCNQERYIRKCLESVLEQVTSVGFEVLVGDDSSGDYTRKIVRELSTRYPGVIQYFKRTRKMGAASNLKDLLARSRGRFVARLDGDDYWLPGKLAAQVGYLQNNTGCSAVYTNAITLDERDVPVGVFNNAGDACFTLSDLLRSGNFLNNSSVLFRKQSIAPWLEINEPLIDYRIHLLHAQFGYLGHIGKALTVYRLNTPGSMVAEKNDYVRKLYWEALFSVPSEKVSRKDRVIGVANFARQVFFHSLSTGRGGLLTEWMPRVYGNSSFGICMTSGFICLAVLRAGIPELWDRLIRLISPSRVRVLHRI